MKRSISFPEDEKEHLSPRRQKGVLVYQMSIYLLVEKPDFQLIWWSN